MLCGETTADRVCHSKDLEPQFSLLQLTEVYPAKLIQALRVQTPRWVVTATEMLHSIAISS